MGEHSGLKMVGTASLGLDLRQINLRHADLRRLILRRTDLWGAKLNGADLRDANLGRAILKDAGVIGVTASRVRFCKTMLRSGKVLKPSCR